MKLLLVPALALAAALSARAQDHAAPRNATVDARGASVVRVRAASGLLRVEGRAGLDEVRVRGTARTARERNLEDIGLRAERSGDAVEVEAEMPKRMGIGYWNDRLDLVIEVPEGMRVEVEDGSGDAEISNVGTLRLEDGSGNVRVRGVRGDMTVSDGSGGIDVRDISGRLTIEVTAPGRSSPRTSAGRFTCAATGPDGFACRASAGTSSSTRTGAAGWTRTTSGGRCGSRRPGSRDRPVWAGRTGRQTARRRERPGDSALPGALTSRAVARYQTGAYCPPMVRFPQATMVPISVAERCTLT